MTDLERLAEVFEDAYSDGLASKDIIRAVLTALREPSEGMLGVGGRIVAGLASGRAIKTYEDDARDAWQAMIDTILSETEPSR